MAPLNPTSADVGIAADVDWQLAECAHACAAIRKHRLMASGWRVLRAGFTLVIIAVLLLTAIVPFTKGVDTASYLAAEAPWMFLLVLFLVFQFWGASWLTAWQIRRNNPNMVAGMRHVISPAGYTIRCGQVESTAQWPGLLRVVETREFFLTFPMKHGAYYLPKRVLTQEQAVAIRAIMQERAADRFVQRSA